MELFCANVGVGLDNIALGREIESAQKEVIETLGEVAEARSMETSHHVKRVAEYSTLLATFAGLGEVEVEILRLAVPMHDLGKLAVPDSVLNKPGALDAEEMGVIRTHARAGFDMLKSSTREIMRTAALIALEHHEKYDGSGYPLGEERRGDQHPGKDRRHRGDVYDALGRERVYKKAWEAGGDPRLLQERAGRRLRSGARRPLHRELRKDGGDPRPIPGLAPSTAKLRA